MLASRLSCPYRSPSMSTPILGKMRIIWIDTELSLWVQPPDGSRSPVHPSGVPSVEGPRIVGERASQMTNGTHPVAAPPIQDLTVSSRIGRPWWQQSPVIPEQRFAHIQVIACVHTMLPGRRRRLMPHNVCDAVRASLIGRLPELPQYLPILVHSLSVHDCPLSSRDYGHGRSSTTAG